jgi:hypothetical protein
MCQQQQQQQQQQQHARSRSKLVSAADKRRRQTQQQQRRLWRLPLVRCCQVQQAPAAQQLQAPMSAQPCLLWLRQLLLLWQAASLSQQ